MGFGAHDWVAHHASHRPDALALACAEDGRSSTWAELDQRVGRVAQVLTGLGVGKGDRVALISENDPRVFEVQFAAMRLGALFVPLNWRLTVHEIAEICIDAEPAVLVHDAVWAEVAAGVADKAGIPQRLSWGTDTAGDYEAVLDAAPYLGPRSDIAMDDPTHILYTSGTTGKPKGSLSTNGTLAWQALNTAHTTGYSQPGCHHLNPMPLFHAGGLHVMANPILYFGGAVTTMTRFVPDQVLAAMVGSTPPVTHFAAIPLMYQAIAGQPGFADADLTAARHFIIAGAIATPELLQLWADRGLPLQPQYGGTEMGPMATALDDEAVSLAKAQQGSTGRRAFHTDIRLVDPFGVDVPDGETGEIWLRGPSITVGYWRKNRDDFFTGDWFRTGDAAKRDADGFYYLAGRTKEMYKSGGENVYPAEVENVLSVHPAVADIAVVGVPDAKWGEVGVAVVVPVEGAAPTLEELHAFAGDKLARFKLPKQVVIVTELPRNVTGKVSREQLRHDHSPTPGVIHEHVADGVAELVVDNPPVNAYGLADIATLVATLRGYTDDERVRVVVLRGEGRGFCGGGDVKEVQNLPGFEGILGQTRGSLDLSLAIAECPVPVIGAIHGYCIGLGVLVAGVCDILLAAPDTPFVLAEADNGATSGIVQAIGLMPDKRLRAAMFTCEPVDSAELHAHGSVLRLVPADELPDAARALAATIAAKRTAVVRGLKAAMAGSIGRDLRTAYRQELSYTLELNMSGEAREARGDFVDGRRGGYLNGRA